MDASKTAMNIRVVLSEFRIYICNHVMNKIPSHTLRLWFYKNAMKFKIGNNTSIHMGCTFDCCRNLIIGDCTVINSKCRIDNRGGVTIGDNVSISQDVIILTADHDINDVAFTGNSRKVIIGNYTWIGTRAMVLPGLTIGEGSVIGAGSTVTKDVPSHTVVVGNPAKFIKNRSQELKYNPSYRRLFQ